MSTKTSFKRIALVAASALALGGFSVISAPQASAVDVGSFVLTNATLVGNGAALTSANYTPSTVLDSRGISSFTVTAGDTVTLKPAVVTGTTVATDSFTVTMVNYGNLITNESVTAAITTPSATTDGIFRHGANNPGPVAPSSSFTATSVAGTYTLTLTLTSHSSANTAAVSNTSSINVTMIVTAASSYSSALSSGLMTTVAGGAASTTTNAASYSASKSASATAAALVQVNLKNADNTTVAASNTDNKINVTVTGPGYVRWLSTAANEAGASTCSATVAGIAYSATTGRSITAQAVDGLGYLSICADGQSGISNVAITITNAAGVTDALVTKTVTFYGSVASIAVSQKNFTIGKAGGGSLTSATGAASSDTITYMPAFVVVTKASDGTLANASAAPTVVSGSTSVVASGTCAADSDSTYGTGSTGYYGCSFTTAAGAKSGDKATLTVRIADPASTTGGYLTTTIDVTVGGAVTKEVISFDKTSYSAGEAMAVTITATDSAGNSTYDGAASPALTGSKAVGGALPAASYYSAGKKASTAGALWAPAIGGDFTVAGTGTDLALTKLSATVSIDGDASASLALDAANAATDAANNAYDEAQNATQAASDALAAVTELAAQVTSLIASVKKLTAAVAKLSKKK